MYGAPRLPVLEIRVHGVSNTPPEQMLLLSSPDDIELAAGDATTGLYRPRRRDPAALVEEQAYSWGQLTSGQRATKDIIRALWLLLLPFALANVAYWARPRFEPVDERDHTVAIASYLARLLSLTLTVSFAMTMTVIGVDLIGWQWTAQLGLARDVPWWLEPFAAHARTSRALLIGLALPTVALLAVYLASRRSLRYEAVHADLGDAVTPSDTTSAPEPQRNPATAELSLATPGFWSGDTQVKQLASVHWRAAMAVVTLVTVALAATAVPQGSVWRPWGWAIVGVLGAVIVLELVRLGLPEVAERTPAEMAYGRSGLSKVSLGLLLLGLSAALVHLGTGAPIAHAPGSDAPLFNNVLRMVFVVQLFVSLVWAIALRHGPHLTRFSVGACVLGGIVAITFMVAGLDARWPIWSAVAMTAALCTSAWVAFGLKGLDHTRPDPLDTAPEAVRGPVWRGAGGVVLAGAGLLLAALFSGGLSALAATYVPSARPLVLPDVMLWTAAGVPCFIISAAVFGALAARWLERRTKAVYDDVLAHYPAQQGPHARVRALAVARARALHDFMDEEALNVVGRLGLTAVIGVIVIAGLSATGRTYGATTHWLGEHSGAVVERVLNGLPTIGNLASLAGLGGIVILGALVYRGDPRRRIVAIVWDLATFWPRACHPFSPTCYAERCVPQLVTRVCNEPERPGFIIAGHSQGALISVAAILQLPESVRRRIELVTFGTQLGRLYGRVFPAFLGPRRLHEVADVLTSDGTVRWRSFYRATDPLGYPVDVRGAMTTDGTPPTEVDHPGHSPRTPLTDPAGLNPVTGEILDPLIGKHSDYPADPEYLAHRDAAARRLLGLPDPA